MPLHRPTRKTLLLSAAGILGVYAFYLLFAWLALPRILQSQATRAIEEKSAHRLAMDLPEFNPFTLALRVRNLRLDQPDGKPLLAVGEMLVDISASSLFRRAFAFDGIWLAAPQVDIELRKDGSLNWSPLIEAMKSKEPQPPSGLPRLDIRNLVVSGGRVDFADRKAGFATRIDPIDAELDEVSSVAEGNGRHRIAARTSQGAQVDWQGDVDLNPVAMNGRVGIAGLDLANLHPYFKQALPEAPAGIASLETGYRAGYADGKASLVLENARADVAGLRVSSGRGATLAIATVSANGGRFDLARRSIGLGKLTIADGGVDFAHGAARQKLGDLTMEDLRADLAQRTASVARIDLKGGRLNAARKAGGRIDLVEAIARELPRSTGSSAEQKPWRFSIGAVELGGFSATLRDETVAPPAVLALDDVGIAADKIGDDLKAPIEVRAAGRAAGGGSFKASGQVVPAGPSADFRLELADLALKPAEPYLASVAKLAIGGGRLSVDGRASYGKEGLAFKGGFALRDLRLDEAGTRNRFLIWKSLDSKSVEATPARLDVRELTLDGLDAALLIGRDRSVNLARILKDAPRKREAADKSSRKTESPFVANVSRLRIVRSEMDFADRSLAFPFATRIHRLRGTVTGLSTRPGAPGLLELEGRVDDYGLARASGQISLLDPTGFADVKLVFRNVEMTRLTPYSATFLGRTIKSGKLSLDLRYKFVKRRVEGDNHVVMDRLTLGERVASPEAKDLPLDLAIALLQDSDGRIELGLPVSGSLDDPQFSYGSLVWKAILNVLTKIATAPFRALASLFGGGEQLATIAFEPGRARLTAPEQEKLVRLAGIMNRRPSLALTLHGLWSESDRVAFQERQLRRAVAERAGYRLEAGEDPGPLSTRDSKIQSAIEDLFIDRFGRAELAALKDGFRKANPGQLPESTAGKVMSWLTTLFREPRALGEDEISQLKGADFHALLFDRLRAREPIPDERLAALARARGRYAECALREAGAPTDRLTLGAPEKAEAAAGEVPLRVEVKTAAKTSAP